MFDILVLLGGLIVAFGTIPQIEQMVRTKSVNDINLTNVILTLVGIVMMMIFSVHHNLIFLILADLINFLLVLVVLILRLHYAK
jgi:uncharacterized protein with PQ loop repeat